jgi:Na+/proline symporter
MLAAYVSTVSTHLNWGTSYLVNDLYRRFLKPGLEERQYVFMGRVVTALLMLVAALLTYVLDTARESFELLLSIGAGTGLLYLLRWFWWRVNAWSEVSAMVASFAVSLGLFIARKNGLEMASHVALIWTVGITTLVWITVTVTTAPAERSRLLEFYRLVRPAGPGWESIRAETGLPPSTDSMANSVLGWVLGCLFVYSALFGTGSYIYGKTGQALVFTVVFVVSAAGLWRLLPRMWKSESEVRGQRPGRLDLPSHESQVTVNESRPPCPWPGHTHASFGRRRVTHRRTGGRRRRGQQGDDADGPRPAVRALRAERAR